MSSQPPENATPREDDLGLIIQRACAGDVTAFNVLVERFQAAAFTVALRILGDRDVASDATQDAIIAAYKAIGRFRGGSFRVWLLRIVHNVCLDYLRVRARRPSVSLDAIIDATPDDTSADQRTLAALGDDSANPAIIAERRELHAMIQRLLLELPPDQRIAVVLSDIEGMPYEEIAEITQANLGTVKSRIARGRARLRDALTRHRELLPRIYRHSSQQASPTAGDDSQLGNKS